MFKLISCAVVVAWLLIAFVTAEAHAVTPLAAIPDDGTEESNGESLTRDHFDAAIEKVMGEIGKLRNDVEAVNKKVTDLTTRVDEVEARADDALAKAKEALKSSSDDGDDDDGDDDEGDEDEGDEDDECRTVVVYKGHRCFIRRRLSHDK